jgi:hypothetical protein
VNVDTPRPYRPVGGVTLYGPFLTDRQVAARIGRPGGFRRSLLYLGCVVGVGRAYPEFQFDDQAQTREVAFLAPLLTRRVSHEEACDWLLRPQPGLAHLSPIVWLAADRDVQRVIDVLPHPSRPVPGHAEVTEAEILAFRAPWVPEPYLARQAA